MSTDMSSREAEARSVFAGRIELLYTIGRHYLSLPFAALCMTATLFANSRPTAMIFVPLIFQIAVVIVAEQLRTSYEFREPNSDAEYWAYRYTFVSAIAGATWGIGAWFWFVPHSFAAQTYLTLAFLGMTATEFIARSAHRPAYLAHALFSLGPLVVLLVLTGETFSIMSAVLVLLFAAVLASYSNGMVRLIDESVLLRRVNAELVARLKREKEDAEVSRDEVEASAQAKSVFLANISHELRTPLNALLGMAQILDRAELENPYREHVKVMLEAGRGLKTLLDDVITLTHDGPERQDIDCDPAQAARAVARLAQPRAWEKQLRLNVAAISDLPLVAADPRRVRQVLLKLVDNALKFTDRGGVEIRVEVEHAGPHPSVRFTVADTGHGVSRELAPKLFRPFSQGDDSYTRRQQGAGLGLAVARRIVETLGGEIGFESEPGSGAAFWFSLPVSGSVRPETDDGIPAEQNPPSRLAMLTYAPDAKAQLAPYLERQGNRVYHAADLAEAIAAASRETFDALIIDAAHTDTIAAAPGVKAPILALRRSGENSPAGAHEVLAWPAPAGALYGALSTLQRRAGKDRTNDDEAGREAVVAVDANQMASLEKSVGLKTLIEILQAYISTAEQLCAAIGEAGDRQKWDEAARYAQDIAGSAGTLGLVAMTAAARAFASTARAGGDAEQLRSQAKILLEEHEHVRHALENLYPDLAA